MSIDTYLKNNQSGNYNLGALFLDCLNSKPPEGIFQIDAATGEEETNGSVLSRSTRLARCLTRIGLQPGDVLALGGRNHLDLHIPYYAAMINGYPVVGVDPYFKFNEIRTLFKQTSPKIAFCQMESAAMYEKAAADLGIEMKIVTFDGDTLTKFMEEHEDKDEKGVFIPPAYDTDKVYAWLVCTSGTTGLPKVAAFKHQTLIDQMLGFIKMTRVSVETVKLGFNMSPVQWISAYFNAFAMPIQNQVKLQTSRPDDLEHLVHVINKYKPVSLMASPSTLILIMNHKEHCDLTCFDLLTVTGSKFYRELALAVKSRLRPNAILMEVYGQTETVGPAVMPNPRGPIGNCGVPMPAAIREVKLVDPDTGDEIKEPNKPGEFWTRGPSFAEYYNRPEETAKAFTADGWYKTGDLLYRDEQNNFFFVDRIKMLIKYRNYHINPYELEELIAKLDGVLEVSVVGIQHPEDGQHPVACVVTRPGHSLTAQEIKDIIADNLSPSKHLHGGVVFLDSLPKTSTGKVARAKLTELVPTLKREL